MRNKKFYPVIGLEVHVELKTKSKMFCGCSSDYFAKEPNTHVCPVCLGLPGALPVPNKKAIEWCVMIGLALNCKIPLFSKFDRKHYFYPDLPKGYQISQYDKPFCVNGWIELHYPDVILGRTQSEAWRTTPESKNDSGLVPSSLARMTKKRIGIRRVHMEEDTAKLIHQSKSQIYENYSLVDFNRSGVPLVEIVTEPNFESANEVIEYLKKLQKIVRYLDVSDADMEKGEMRLEPNISLIQRHPELVSGSQMPKQVRHDNASLPKYKAEVKNINSFRFVEKAINYEIERQKKILGSGKIPLQETRGWDSKKQITVSQRVKEEAMDYRYFPEPDIPPIRFTKSQISNLKSQIPELPDEKFARFRKEYALSDYDAEILTREKDVAWNFEEAVRMNSNLQAKKENHTDIKTFANWIINKKVDLEKTAPAELIKIILQSEKTEKIGIRELEGVIDKVIIDNQKAISDYKKGRKNAIMFLLGLIIKQLQKKVDVNTIRENLEKKLSLP